MLLTCDKRRRKTGNWFFFLPVIIIRGWSLSVDVIIISPVYFIQHCLRVGINLVARTEAQIDWESSLDTILHDELESLLLKLKAFREWFIGQQRKKKKKQKIMVRKNSTLDGRNKQAKEAHKLLADKNSI